MSLDYGLRLEMSDWDGDASGGYVITVPLTLAKGVSAWTWRRVPLMISSTRWGRYESTSTPSS